jgi:hypothetical protein
VSTNFIGLRAAGWPKAAICCLRWPFLGAQGQSVDHFAAATPGFDGEEQEFACKVCLLEGGLL